VMLPLLALLLFAAPIRSNVILDELNAMESALPIVSDTFTGPLFGLIVDDLCSTYPSIRPSTEEEFDSFKNEFAEFLADSNANEHLLEEVLSGFPSKYQFVPERLKKLGQIAKKDFEDLSEEEK
ncbi:hypothetical protein PENTCL1PPCAC_5722, partial [Pristionchus entomophagus]